MAQPVAIAADAAGDIFIADDVRNVITKVSPGGAPAPIATGLNAAQGVAVDAVGNVYIADTGSGNVLKISANGAAPIAVATGLTAPRGVAVDESGNVYISDAGTGNIVEVPATGGAQINVATGLSKPAGVAVDSAGNLYIAEQDANRIDEISAGSNALVRLAISGLNAPDSIAVDAAGNLYISETAGQQVVRVDAATEAVSIVAGNGNTGYTGDGGAATLATVNQPAGIAVDGSGSLYIADSYNQAVRKVTVNSAATIAFLSTNVGSTSSDSPVFAEANNIGNMPLTIRSATIVPSPDAGSFALDNGNVANACAASPLAVGASCQMDSALLAGNGRSDGNGDSD